MLVPFKRADFDLLHRQKVSAIHYLFSTYSLLSTIVPEAGSESCLPGDRTWRDKPWLLAEGQRL